MIKCIGCGALLQNTDSTKEGYTPDLSKDLCERCFRIRNYNEYSFLDKDNNYYLDVIKKIEKTGNLVVLVCDFLNLDSIDELQIKNPVILVLSKRDLIPRSLDEDKLLNKIKTNLNIVDKLVVCSNNNYNLDLLYCKINKYKKSKDVYVIGYTNAGKSTLINKLIKNYSDTETKITTSVLPSTTLDLIEVKINDELTIFDTPGLLDEGSIILTKGDYLKKMIPRKEIKPRVIQVKTDQTIVLDDLVRIDVKSKTNLIFYVSNDLKIDRYYKEKDIFSGLEKYNISLKGNQDLIIKGLGFVKTTGDCDLVLYLDKEVDYKIRSSII